MTNPDLVLRRRHFQEREVLLEASRAISDALGMLPDNPCDTQAIFAFATTGQLAIREALGAINGILAGPHVDFDYIEQASEDIDKVAIKSREGS